MPRGHDPFFWRENIISLSYDPVSLDDVIARFRTAAKDFHDSLGITESTINNPSPGIWSDVAIEGSEADITQYLKEDTEPQGSKILPFSFGLCPLVLWSRLRRTAVFRVDANIL
ncbi:hypothetical protein PSTT_15853 [Puccinia striiformis]|uniref:Uncharacterized protein n=2 Tax=Puccinia striiformis TaxID=27350 RepID=A0A0L0W1A1_9BASI|nr:hypothetical protein PSTG_01466 [Puccinia striiformis f. sp. tritici PST-78]POV96107.1 hypothetical protein PSTT_15853 [Puccinia striiformis]